MSNRLLQDFSGKAYRIGWDAGNGAAGPVLDMLVDRLPGQHFTHLHRCRRHLPQPPSRSDGREATSPTSKQLVEREQLDFGIAFDGDGDRIGAVDGNGPRDLGRPAADDPRRAGS